jgi:hypothetical protein
MGGWDAVNSHPWGCVSLATGVGVGPPVSRVCKGPFPWHCLPAVPAGCCNVAAHCGLRLHNASPHVAVLVWGVQLPSGRLLYSGTTNEHACVWYSDDHGATYSVGKPFPGSESSIALIGAWTGAQGSAGSLSAHTHTPACPRPALTHPRPFLRLVAPAHPHTRTHTDPAPPGHEYWFAFVLPAAVGADSSTLMLTTRGAKFPWHGYRTRYVSTDGGESWGSPAQMPIPEDSGRGCSASVLSMNVTRDGSPRTVMVLTEV